MASWASSRSKWYSRPRWAKRLIFKELVGEDVVQEDVAEAVAAEDEGFSLREWGEAQGGEELQGRDLGTGVSRWG